MNIEEEHLEQLKRAHPGGVFEGSISFNDETDELHEVAFLYRKPTTVDIEAHSKAAQRNPLIANLNLIQTLIIHPESASVIGQVREYPVACGRFMDEAVMPFFGANTVVKSRKL